MTDIPKRPEHYKFIEMCIPMGTRHLYEPLIHEHAVAKVAVEALQRVAGAMTNGCAWCGTPNKLSGDQQHTCMVAIALAKINASGWQP